MNQKEKLINELKLESEKEQNIEKEIQKALIKTKFISEENKLMNEEINNHKKLEDEKKLNLDSLELNYKIKNQDSQMYKNITEQNKKLQKALIDIGHIPEQNQLLKEQINDNKKSADEQIEKLKIIISKNEISSTEQNDGIKTTICITICIAIFSIAISIYSINSSTNKADEIYQKENNSTSKQHQELLDTIKKSSLKDEIKILIELEKKNQIYNIFPYLNNWSLYNK